MNSVKRLAPWQESADINVVQTGVWILPDERPLPAELEAFLDAGTPPVYVGFGSIRAPKDLARVAIEAIRAQGRRAVVSRGWADDRSRDAAARRAESIICAHLLTLSGLTKVSRNDGNVRQVPRRQLGAPGRRPLSS